LACASYTRYATPQTPEARTFQVQIKDICTDKLDDAICLRDALFDDDDATEEVDKCVFKETFAGEFDAVSAMDGLCECGGVDVEFVQCDYIFLVVCGGRLDLGRTIFGRTSATGAGMVGNRDAVVTCVVLNVSVINFDSRTHCTSKNTTI
jgi:hypothetical protein